MNSSLISDLLEVDFGSLWAALVDVVRTPGQNPTAFALVLAAVTIAVVLVIMLLALSILSGDGDDDEDEYVEEAEYESERDGVVVSELHEPLPPEDPERRRARRVISTIAWTLVFAAVWVVGGYVSAEDTVCQSCHLTGGIHTVRVQDPDADPHGEVACVSCHESSSRLVTLTTRVPGRAVHFVVGYLNEALATDYGTPVANATCARCHAQELTVTLEDSERGLRMLHVQPLEAKARCSDCHAPEKETGIINRFTVGMAPCLRCHDQKTASAECDYCHTKDVGVASRPRSVVRARTHIANLDCGGCHSQESCDACHGVRMPHTTEFMGTGHAREAVEDLWFNGGKTCKRCHTETRRPCTSCHRSAKFLSHGPYMIKGHQTADPYNNGCDGCHGYLAWIVGRNFCANCHTEYAQGQVHSK